MATDLISVFIDVNEAKILSWKVRREDAVFEGQVLAEIENVQSTVRGRLSELRAPQSGYIKSLGISEGETVTKDQAVASIVLCGHPVEYAGMCSICGKNVDSSRSTFIGHAHPQLAVSKREAERIEAETAARLLKHKKLSLVLDLDHTLIHAAVEHDIRNKEDILSPDIHHFTLPPNPLNYFVKLRPGLMTFLHTLRDLYELHIYTMGTKQYATKIAEILDKTGEMFQEHRIVSRDDAQDLTAKNLTRLFPCDNTMVVIVDDREDVWVSDGQVSPNLLRIEPFHFFTTTRELNALPGDKETSETELNKDTKQDENLEHMLRVLKEIHTRFYGDNNSEKDVKSIISNMKKSVLEDCTILFSGLIPMREPPQKAEIWRLAQTYGAECRIEFDQEVTHVIAAKPGTSKVNRALQTPGTYLVTLKWLLESARTWKRVSELDYPLEGCPVITGEQQRKRRKMSPTVDESQSKTVDTETVGQKAVTSEDEEDSQDDEEMASLLEKELMEELEEEL